MFWLMGLMTSSCIQAASLGTIFLARKASVWPEEKTVSHGVSMSLADWSDGCHLMSALASLCLIGAYIGSNLEPDTNSPT